MAYNGQFKRSLKILAAMAAAPDQMHTSADLAEKLSENAVVVRRSFVQLQRHGFIEQRRGPKGGARLMRDAKSIGLGDVYLVTVDDPGIASTLRRTRKSAVLAMNEITLTEILGQKRTKRHSALKTSALETKNLRERELALVLTA
jgi:DNA-binding IscR family transcriptional regulator